MVSNIDKQGLAGDSGEISDSEDEEGDVGTVGPQMGSVPVQIPTSSPAPVEDSENSYLPRPLAESSEGCSQALPNDDEAIPIIHPIARRQLKRAEQKQERRSSLRLKEKGLNNKPP